MQLPAVSMKKLCGVWWGGKEHQAATGDITRHDRLSRFARPSTTLTAVTVQVRRLPIGDWLPMGSVTSRGGGLRCERCCLYESGP